MLQFWKSETGRAQRQRFQLSGFSFEFVSNFALRIPRDNLIFRRQVEQQE